jgi:hypothetical protein
MLTHACFHILRAVCLVSVSLTANKLQGNLGYHLKHETADLGRIGLNQILNSVFGRGWKFGT